MINNLWGVVVIVIYIRWYICKVAEHRKLHLGTLVLTSVNRASCWLETVYSNYIRLDIFLLSIKFVSLTSEGFSEGSVLEGNTYTYYNLDIWHISLKYSVVGQSTYDDTCVQD